MAEQQNTQNTEQNTENTEGQSNAPQYSPIQLKAIEQGWIPKEEFNGSEEDFIDAPEFVRRGELFAKISSQSSRIKQVEQALEALRMHNTKIKEVEYERALKNLKQAKRTAQINGESEQVFQLEDKIEEVEAEREAIKQNAQVQPSAGPSPEFVTWQEQNPWYENNKVMQAAADQIGRELHAKGMSPSEVLKEVTKQIKEEFPHKFQRKAPANSAVEGSSRGTPRGTSEVSMSEQERDIMKKIVRTGVMTEAEYKAQLKNIRERA